MSDDSTITGATPEQIAAAYDEYNRWSTACDTSRPRGEQAWVCRQNDNETWQITTFHRHDGEADRARHEQALVAAINAALAERGAGR